MKKIVLTGGPGAGKSTIISYLKEELEKKGYKVITVSETATDLHNYKIYFEPGKTSVSRFQNLVLQVQYSKEASINNYVTGDENEDNIIVIYDRGIFDNRAYLDSDDAFRNLLKVNNLSSIELLDNYDLVIDMVSASVLNENIYENNEVRKESKEEAKNLDKKTSEAWLLHHNFNMVMPTVNVLDKNKKVLKIIEDFLSSNKRIDSKFEEVNKENSEDYVDERYKKIYEFDMYLKMGDHHLDCLVSCGAPYDSDFIVTERKLNGESSYLYRIITHKDGCDYLFKSSKINLDSYEWLISHHDIIKSEGNNYVRYIDDYNINEIKTNKNGKFKKIIKSK